jgi:hypothetical protein
LRKSFNSQVFIPHIFTKEREFTFSVSISFLMEKAAEGWPPFHQVGSPPFQRGGKDASPPMPLFNRQSNTPLKKMLAKELE